MFSESFSPSNIQSITMPFFLIFLTNYVHEKLIYIYQYISIYIHVYILVFHEHNWLKNEKR